MNLILLLEHEVEDGEIVRLPGSDARARHIVHHLKKSDHGETVRAGIVDGPVGFATVQEINDAGCITLRLDALCDPPPKPRVELLLGLPYPRVMKQMWAILSSLGVSRICVFKAELSDPDFGNTSALTREVYDPLILEGLSQSVETRRPVVDAWQKRGLSDVLAVLDSGAQRRLFCDVGDFPTIRRCLRTTRHLPASTKTVVAIGPERGWTDAEATLFKNAGFDAASISRCVLRTDVACIAAISLVVDALREEDEEEATER